MTERPAASLFHIPSLDGVRTTAFMIVFLAHAGVPGVPGGFGVTIFFFLSGYLITTLLRMEVERKGSISFKLFYLRRALRILPPFYLVLAVATLLTLGGVLPGTITLRAFLAQALHYANYWDAVHGFDGTAAGTGVYWSLAVEEHFYALFPALFALFLSARLSGPAQRRAFFAICAAVLVWRCVLVFYFKAPADRTYLTTDTRFDLLLMGCGLAVAGNPMLDAAPAKAPSGRLILALLGAAFVLLVTFVLRSEQFRETLRYTIQGLALYPIFYAAIRFPSWGPFRLFNLGFMRFLGKLSYSLYLVHQVVLSLLEAHVHLPVIVRGAGAFLISLALSWLIWSAIEQPIARIRKRLEASARAPRTAACSQAFQGHIAPKKRDL
jgi:peptidoglycan/LPS O-acetylase OafA/YrhL